ncbi:MAG: multicopper oxidase domain-containing protein, partial [bacterium]
GPAERAQSPSPRPGERWPLLALLLAGLVAGVVVVATDSLLWAHAPTHAYALMGFVAFDALLLLLVWIRNPLGPRLVPAWGALQVLLMLLDILTAPTVGHTYAELAALLFGNGAWVALLLTRLVQASWPLPLALATRVRAGSVARLEGTHPGIPPPIRPLPLRAGEEDRVGRVLSRRRFLKYSALGLVVVGSGAFLSRLYGLEALAGSSSPPGRYRLSITEALVEQIDGTLVYMWAFEDLDRGRNPSQLPQVPGPVLEATAGGSLVLEITNDLPQEHAFAIPGLFTSSPIPPGATREFDIPIPAGKAGAYLYFDPLNEPANRVLGLHGALVVSPPTGNTPYSNPTPNVQRLFNALGTSSEFPGEAWRRERTKIWLFHQVDPKVHRMAERGVDPREIAAFLKTPGRFTPRYFTINGESGAFAAHNHDITPRGRIGQPHVIHQLNAGLVTHSPHIHGNHVYVLSINNVVQGSLFLVDTWTMKPLDRVDWLLPFERPPDIPGDPATPLRDLIPTELGLVIGGVAQSPLKYPMHCHTEMSQTAAGGNYPQGLVTDWDLTGDLDRDFPFVPVNGEDGESDDEHDH